MIIAKKFISNEAQFLIERNRFAEEAYYEVVDSITRNANDCSGKFIINNTEKNLNGVVPVKYGIYRQLEEEFGWYREKPLPYFKNAGKGGPIDVYKEFGDQDNPFNVGLEFETGNISSAHRAMNKLCLGINHGDLHMAFLIMPIHILSYYLTDRVSNYEELEPYFDLLRQVPFVVLGFDADIYDPNAPVLAKGKDGMSKRSIRKWKNR